MAIGVAVAFNLWETRGQTLFSDEWGRLGLAQQDTLRNYLLGYSGHLTFLHSLLYRVLFGTFGADSYLPFRLVEALLIGVNGWLFYSLARWRASPGLAAAFTLPLLFLGSAFEVTATPFGIVVLLPMAFGLGALVCMTRLGRTGDPLACVLLVMSIASLSDGLAFLAGAVAVLVLQSGRGALRRCWVVAIPALLYVAWYVWAHHNGIPNRAPIGNIQQVPAEMLDSAAAGVAAVSGFFGGTVPTANGQIDLQTGYLLLGLALVALGIRWREGKRPAREIWVPLAMALAFWALLAMVISDQRPVYSSRYFYPSVVFLLLIGVEILRDVQVSRRGILVVAGLLAVSIVPNAIAVNREAGKIRTGAITTRVELGALELLAREVPGAALPTLTSNRGSIVVGTGGFMSGSDYVAAVARYGSPAFSPEKIAAVGGIEGAAADQVLLKGGDLTTTRFSGSHGQCELPNSPVPVPSGGLVVIGDPGRTATIGARRFGPVFAPLKLPAGAAGFVVRSAATEGPPWIAAVQGATVCRSSTQP